MGYSHSWTVNSTMSDFARNLSFATFTALAERIIIVAEEQGIKIADRSGELLGGWEVSDSEVSLNGFDIESYETFDFHLNNGTPSNYCKTNLRPYDTVVTALLVAVKHSYNEDVVINSDGDVDNWVAGLTLFEDATGFTATVPYNDFVAVAKI